MRLCVQRVSRASVRVDGVNTGSIEKGVLIFFGVEKGDSENDIEWMANKITNLRIFPDDEGKMSLSLLDTGFSALIVSQFTLAADCTKGRRPDFGNAERPDIAETFYDLFLTAMRAVLGDDNVGAGVFGAHMDVSLVNDGPVTFIVERGNKQDNWKSHESFLTNGDPMKLETLTLPPMGENCYILHDGKECVIFDPGSYFPIIRKFLDDNNLKVKYIMNTHAHFDHVGAVAELKAYTGAPFLIHSGESEILAKTASDPLRFGLPTFTTPDVDKFISDDEVVEFGTSRIKAIHTPGHTPGGMCFLITPENILISGDTLFFESVGRTDFPYASSRDIVVAIKEKLYTLDPKVEVYPGHGTSTTIGHERDNNPFVHL